MIIKWFDRTPGGRVLVLAIPFVLLILGSWTMTPPQLTQLYSVVTLALCIAGAVAWRNSLRIFFTEQQDVGAIWLSLGVFTIIATTIFSVGYSFILRHIYGFNVPLADSYFISTTRFTYSFGFACLYLAPLSRRTEVPVWGWLSLVAIITVSVVSALIWFV